MSNDFNNEELNNNGQMPEPEVSENKENEYDDPLELEEAHTYNLYYMRALNENYRLQHELDKKNKESKKNKTSCRWVIFLLYLLSIMLFIQSLRIVTISDKIKKLNSMVQTQNRVIIIQRDRIKDLESKVQQNSEDIDTQEEAPIFQYPVFEKTEPVEREEIDKNEEVENEEDNVLEL